MATQVQFRRGNTANMSAFTGAAGEITVDTDKKTVVVHDGSTVGGTTAATEAKLSANVSTLQGQITSNASAAYTNAVSYTDSKILTANSAITGNAATAYTNAVSYTDSKILTANGAITGNAATAYTNATIFASNASNINTGTLAEARLPFRMNQNVNSANDVTFGSLTLTGNLTVSGNVTTIGANNLSIVDNFIYINSNNTTQNIDVGIAANYNSAGYAHTGVFRDASDGIWKVFDNYTPEPDANVNIDTTNTSFHLANFQANTIYGGNTSTNWFIANTAGAYLTGTINATSYTVGTSTIANSSGVYTGVVNASSGVYGTVQTATQGTIDHNSLANYVANKHIDHTAVSITAGNGLSGGGDISTTRTVSVLANNGITANSTGLFVTQGTGAVVNSTGVHVNSTYIGTLSANNTTYVNGKTEGNLNVNSATYATSAGSATNASAATNATYATSAGSATNASAATNATYATSAGSATNATTANNSTYAFGLSSASTTATASTVVTRDVNGDFTGRYVNSSYFNSSDDISAGSITYLMGKFGDNYYRSATAAKVATFISGQSMNISGSATNATYATSAGSATNATSAGSATNATYATSAGSATNATYATSAGSATNASAATNATTATNISGGSVNATTGTFSSTLIASASAYGGVGTLTDGANVAVNLASYNNWNLTLAGNRNLDNPTNLNAGQSGVIWVTQDATGSRTLTFGSYWKFPSNTAPTLSTTASSVDLIVYTVKSSTIISAQCINSVG